MTDAGKQEDLFLDRLFAEARRTSPEVSPDFLARVLAGAEAEQDMRLNRKAAPSFASSPLRHRVAAALSGIRAIFGAWGGLSLATATVAGVWIGFAGSNTALVQAALLDRSATYQSATVQQSSLLSDSDILALAGE